MMKSTIAILGVLILVGPFLGDGLCTEEHHPPIDCPLRKQGIDPHGTKPFEDIEKYIAFLEKENRTEWQKPDQVVAALNLAGSETVADVGAGSGYFSFRFASALPEGKVVAVDIEPDMLKYIHHKAMQDEVGNIEVILAQTSDPSVPSGVDLVFICDVLHHVAERPAWLQKLHSQLGPDARVALIEFKEGDLPEGPPEEMKIPRAKLLELMASVGFVLREEPVGLLPYQHFLVFGKM